MLRSRKRLLVFVIFIITFAPMISSHEKEKHNNNIEASNQNGGNNWGGGGGGGGGGGSGGGSYGGGGGWGWGGGGGGWWGWGCRRSERNYNGHKKRVFDGGDNYKIGEFAQCMGKGRCHSMRLDCPLHCGGPCFYDCKNMCKAHCQR